MLLKRLVGHFDKISGTEWCHESAAFLLSTVKNGGTEYVRILDFFGDEFHQGKPALLRLKLMGMAKLRARFLLALTKNTVFWSDLLL